MSGYETKNTGCACGLFNEDTLTALLPPAILLLLLVNLVMGIPTGHAGKPVKAEQAAADLATRIKPVGEVKFVEAPAPAADGAGAPAVAAASGKTVFDGTCTVCHTSGAAGAPKLGDKTAWAPRLKGGVDGLYASALKGKNAMPAKGGNASLSEGDVKAAVDYLVSQAK